MAPALVHGMVSIAGLVERQDSGGANGGHRSAAMRAQGVRFVGPLILVRRLRHFIGWTVARGRGPAGRRRCRVSMMLPAKVSRSTIAAQSRGSVKVLVQPEKDSLLAMATEFFSSRSVRTWNSSSAPRRSSSM